MNLSSLTSLLGRESFQKEVARFTFLAVIFLQSVIFLTIATDNNGDPNQYLEIARLLFSGDAPITLLRFIGYPVFIKLSSFNLYALNATFFCQYFLFTFAILLDAYLRRLLHTSKATANKSTRPLMNI
jgi:hypothetical protein